jgi:hypothetical protein
MDAATNPSWSLAQLQHPAFAPLQPLLHKTQWHTFPTLARWNALASRPYTTTQKIVQFVDPATVTLDYEHAIAQQGKVATRANNWHDCFNAFVWFTYPKIKAALNNLHIHALQRTPSPHHRCAVRDAATLLDESGVLLPYCDEKLNQALYQRAWKTLCQTHAHRWGGQIEAFLIGHANFEKALQPYIGWTGKAWLIKVSSAFFHYPMSQKCQVLDDIISKLINQGKLSTTHQLPPLPLLGIPGWWPLQDEAFYQNAQYFRQPTLHSPA